MSILFPSCNYALEKQCMSKCFYAPKDQVAIKKMPNRKKEREKIKVVLCLPEDLRTKCKLIY